MLRLLRSRRLNDSGAVSIIFALMVIMLLSVAALGTDIGNSVARRTVTQTQADFAAFSAAEKMTATGTAGATVPATVLSAVAAAMNNNQPQDDKRACWTSKTCVTTGMLTDSDLTNGDVRFTSAGLQVTAPNNYISFGMARIMGFQGTQVGAAATVNVLSPGLPLPFYTTSTCLWGTQTLKDNSGGLSLSVDVPKLWAPAEPPNDSYNATLTTLSPTQVALNASGSVLTIAGSGFSSATQVGFFRSDQSAPTTVVTSNTAPQSKSSSQLKVVIPASVTAVNDIWYVRVFNGTNWSSRSGALALQVGDAVLQCDPGSKSGNFGSLDIPGYSGSTNDQLALNIALGPNPPVSLAQYPTPQPTGYCPTTTVPPTVYSSSGLPGMNCVDTQPGLRSIAATPGFITGVNGVKGRLDKDTSADCKPAGQPTRDTLSVYPAQGINDDLLTCYFTNLTTKISDITSPSYAGPAVLSPDIYNSPRFGYVPVFSQDPGGSKTMPILSFQPCFITDQPSGADGNNNLHDTTGDTDNGLVMKGSSLRALRVIFFNASALPNSSSGGPTSSYLGSGPRIIRLVN